ncbi:MAG: 3-phosphoshikimate 1-carboxyvinyltransferase [Bacteroidales bacterium]|nr:3-phosphoshikimate 1-carboxyvinyltransferase [Bacteroidales bacterium]
MKLHCDITLPASKSESNRALMIAAYGGFAPDFQNLSDSHDTKVLMKAINSLPFIDSRQRTIPRWKCFAFGVANDIKGKQQTIDIADCGTAARFLTTYLACREGDWILTGTERMRQRPIAPLVEALRRLSADIQYVEEDGFLPLHINGKPLAGGKVDIDMSQSSQFVSSLLLAAPMWPQGLELELLGELNSLPYLDMTLNMMCHFLAQAERHGRTVIVKPQPYQEQPFTVEPDWTAASYWYEMAAFSEECEIRLRSLSLSKGRQQMQGDSIIAEWMQQLGVGTFVEDNAVVLRKIPYEKRPLSFDFSQHPDLYPTIAATCAGLQTDARFTGLQNLTHKESNRVEAMEAELAKLGHRPVRFCSHNDHRIVMALAPLSMLVGNVSFDHPEVVEKSYPGFWKDASFCLLNR